MKIAGKVYGYARVSTTEQLKNGRTLESQEEVRYNVADEIYNESFKETKLDRPELDKLLGRLEKGATLRVSRKAI